MDKIKLLFAVVRDCFFFFFFLFFLFCFFPRLLIEDRIGLNTVLRTYYIGERALHPLLILVKAAHKLEQSPLFFFIELLNDVGAAADKCKSPKVSHMSLLVRALKWPQNQLFPGA